VVVTGELCEDAASHLRPGSDEPAHESNLQYAQAITAALPTGTGIIDTIHLVEVARA